MLKLDIPGFGPLEAEYLVMDLNGTLGLEGVPDDGVIRRLRELSGTLELIVLTADTHGHAKDLPADFGMRVEKLTPGDEDEQKRSFVRKIGSNRTITLGNGSNDALMLKESRIGICVIGEEGASLKGMQNADIVVHHIHHALDLLLHPKRLLATMRS
jgi:soluble P-type ATPase